MGFQAAVAVVGLALQVKSMDDQRSAGNQAADAARVSAAEQRKQFESQQRIADIANARTRAETARQTRVARAAVVSLGANTGTSTSSGVGGGVSSIGTQGAATLGTFGAIEANQADIVSSQGRQAAAQASGIQAQADISSAQAMFSLGSTVFDKAGGFKTIFDIVKK